MPHNYMGLIKEIKRSKAFWDLELSLAGTTAVDDAFRPVFKILDIEYKLEEIAKESNQRIVRGFVKTIEKLEK